MKPKRGKSILVVSLLFAAVLLFLMSPIFSLEEITVNGNEKYSDKEILAMADVKEGMNVFRLSFNNSHDKLLENTYIKYAEIVSKLPNKLTINIVEREICGYVPYMGTYLYIDQDGYVLENLPATGTPRPIVTGLKFQEFSVGERLEVENRSSFDVVMIMSKLLLNYEFLDSVREMNISNPDDIHLYVNNVDVLFGDIEEADKKMRIIIQIMATIPEGDKGVLHVENVNETPYFTYTL